MQRDERFKSLVIGMGRGRVHPAEKPRGWLPEEQDWMLRFGSRDGGGGGGSGDRVWGLIDGRGGLKCRD